MFSLFRMVSYFWELGGDVLALYRCKSDLFAFPCPSTCTSRTPSLGAWNLHTTKAQSQLNSPSLPSCGFISQQFSPRASTFPRQLLISTVCFLYKLNIYHSFPVYRLTCAAFSQTVAVTSPQIVRDLQTASSPPQTSNKGKELQGSIFPLWRRQGSLTCCKWISLSSLWYSAALSQRKALCAHYLCSLWADYQVQDIFFFQTCFRPKRSASQSQKHHSKARPWTDQIPHELIRPRTVIKTVESALAPNKRCCFSWLKAK